MISNSKNPELGQPAKMGICPMWGWRRVTSVAAESIPTEVVEEWT